MKQKVKKIGTITFHWAANYGAVLQAYALQKHLKNCGRDTEIIDYVPVLTSILLRIQALRARDFSFWKREKKIKKFRKKELTLSKKRYYNNSALFSAEDEYSAVICGSDQIWNESFAMPPKRLANLSYFLDFAGSAKRISYAASFGANKIPNDMVLRIKPLLERFDTLTVRENTGAEILKDMGLDSTVVADPTLLLTAADYSALLENRVLPDAPRVFSYILHKNQTVCEEISAAVNKNFDSETDAHVNDYGVYEWLSFVRDSKFLVTNSFHGTVFSLLFHTPFITVPVKGSGMNDRILTLLRSVGLEDRIAEECDQTKINELISSPIDWDAVDKKIAELSERSAKVLSDI
ncbi:MAG: polysaccharide pyruvyl transferase family protein [Clostridia bacterium]|nr:polysaccharide pyruvyl transferase family protein [Clostridia bacterium]